MELNEVVKFLSDYDGEPLSFMEVCGTHTAAVSENGIPSMLSPKIRLISGPGCPVCVTVASYIDRLCELALKTGYCVVTFGDMIRVSGSKKSLADIKSEGGNVHMVYSPFEIIKLAENDKDTIFVFAAVGFETTTPIYALLIDRLIESNIKNVRLLTALKTMPAAISRLCEGEGRIDGFIAPGNVSVITGSGIYEPIAKRYNVPFVVSGFSGKELIASIYALVKLSKKAEVLNLYKSAVDKEGNKAAQEIVNKYFKPCDAAWRGMGIIKGSGLILRDEYMSFDAGSAKLNEDSLINQACSCAEVITGIKAPVECPLFSKVCTPQNPQGACMVSNEGSCFHYYINNRR